MKWPQPLRTPFTWRLSAVPFSILWLQVTMPLFLVDAGNNSCDIVLDVEVVFALQLTRLFSGAQLGSNPVIGWGTVPSHWCVVVSHSLLLLSLSGSGPSSNLADARLVIYQWPFVLETRPGQGPVTRSPPGAHDCPGSLCWIHACLLFHKLLLRPAIYLVHAAQLWREQWSVWNGGEHKSRPLRCHPLSEFNPSGIGFDPRRHRTESSHLRTYEWTGLAQRTRQPFQVGVAIRLAALW